MVIIYAEKLRTSSEHQNIIQIYINLTLSDAIILTKFVGTVSNNRIFKRNRCVVLILFFSFREKIFHLHKNR